MTKARKRYIKYMIFNLKYLLRCDIAELLFKLGFKYKTSERISGERSYGYGKRDRFGFWQFSLDHLLDQ